MLRISFIKNPFVSRSKHNQALEALEEANREIQIAIRSLFDTHQRYRRELLLAEKKRLEDLQHAFDLQNGSPCEIGGLSLRYKKS